MPISATGRSTAKQKALERGFTLLEMLVALVIVGMLAGLAMVSVNQGSRGLRFEAQRLAQLMILAREEAMLRGAPIRMETDERGLRFLVLREQRWQPLLDDGDLRPRQWLERTTVLTERADGAAQIEFGRDAIDVPFRLVLRREGAQAVIVADGLGRFVAR
jgi:general secretion pathway protein H